jgi:16S rRNA G966 N2-methylase RsmD
MEAIQQQPPLRDFDFSLLTSEEFKEDSVRAEITDPILKQLGYSVSGKNRIIRSKKLEHPFVKTASGRRAINIFPDYLLKVGSSYAWVLDAKEPNEELKTGDNREQAYFYAIHPDVRVRYYALCNGSEFIVFAVDTKDPVLYFHLSELSKHWQSLEALLSAAVFEPERQQSAKLFTDDDFDYASAKPLPELRTKKQAAKRHFGVHGYFTRQSWDLVQAYIKNFTKPGDLVLDPFGGYGVTALEALMLNRRAIHIDLNPLSPFILRGLVAPVSVQEMKSNFDKLQTSFQTRRPRTSADVAATIKRYGHPKGIELSSDADVATIEQLFTDEQLAELGLLKNLVSNVKDTNLRDSFLLAFSSTITKINLTYHPSSSRGDNAGDSAAFRYYRYRIAPAPVDLDVFATFTTKVEKLIAAKKEIGGIITKVTVKNATIRKGTATELDEIATESVDYIYTDPPYGAKIAYLDLSVMWNAWLDLPVTDDDYKLEAIEGGTQHKTKEDYSQLIAASIKEMYRVLKFDRWMSFVFQHKDPVYWHLIVETAQKIGFEYMGSVTQRVGQTSFKKRQNPFTVLHGQLIINFRKTRNPRTLMKVKLGVEMSELVMQTVEAVIAMRQGATLEEIYNELIVKGMEFGFLHELSREQHNVPKLLRDNFDFNKKKQVYQIRKNTRFKTTIPLELRIKYYLLSYMRQMQRQNINPRFDDIVLNIMPLLKNGITPKHQTILGVLEMVARHVGDARWELIEQQLELNLMGTVAVGMPDKKRAHGVESLIPTKRTQRTGH